MSLCDSMVYRWICVLSRAKWIFTEESFHVNTINVQRSMSPTFKRDNIIRERCGFFLLSLSLSLSFARCVCLYRIFQRHSTWHRCAANIENYKQLHFCTICQFQMMTRMKIESDGNKLHRLTEIGALRLAKTILTLVCNSWLEATVRRRYSELDVFYKKLANFCVSLIQSQKQRRFRGVTETILKFMASVSLVLSYMCQARRWRSFCLLYAAWL